MDTVNILIHSQTQKPLEEYQPKKSKVYLFTEDLKTKSIFPKQNHFIHMGYEGQTMMHDSQEGAERTGNESRDGYEKAWYFHKATIFWIPKTQ